MLPDPAEHPLVTVEEAARWLGLGRSACYDAVSRGEVPSLRIGRKLLVPVAELRRMVGLDTGATQPDAEQHSADLQIVGGQ